MAAFLVWIVLLAFPLQVFSTVSMRTSDASLAMQAAASEKQRVENLPAHARSAHLGGVGNDEAPGLLASQMKLMETASAGMKSMPCCTDCAPACCLAYAPFGAIHAGVVPSGRTAPATRRS